MKKYLMTLAAFLLIAAVVVGLLLYVNGSAPKLENYGSIPADIQESHYVVSGLTYDEGAGGYHVYLYNARAGEKLAITLYFRLAELWQGDTLIAELSRRTTSQRTYSVEVTADEAGCVNLLIKTAPATIDPGDYSLKTLFTPYTAQRPKVIIGGLEHTSELISAGNGFYRVLIGLYIMLIMGCLSMFRRKRGEKYLLTVCVAASCVLLYLMTALEGSSIDIPYGIASTIGSGANVLAVISLAYTCVAFFGDSAPHRLRGLYSLPVFLGLSIVCAALNMFTEIYVYQFVRRLMLFPVLTVLACALKERKSGSGLIFAAYSVMEGIAVFLYISNCILDMEYSPFMMFFRVKEISNLVFVCACAFLIFDRFSFKFQEADRLADQVRALNVDLEHRIEERTRQLRDEQERKHGMMLNVFHDLRSPLFVLRGRLNSMEKESGTDSESVAVMSERVAYLERLTEDLFLTAKLESGDIQYDQDFVDLTALCETVIRDLSSTAESKKVALCGRRIDGGVTTWGDVFRLQQAVINLVENAILYTPEGGGVTLSLEKSGDWCLLSVADTGKGIRREDLPRVFERYYRVNRGDKRSSGLGLSIAKEIVSAHAGDILIDSTVGKGSVFTIKLPYCDDSENSDGR